MKLSALIESGELRTANVKNFFVEEYPLLAEAMEDKARELLEESGLALSPSRRMKKFLLWDLSYSQGSGVSFCEGCATEWQEFPEFPGFLFKFGTFRNTSHYFHAHSFYVDWKIDYPNDADDDETNAAEAFAEKKAEELTETLRKICKDLEDFGHSYMESEDASAEAFKAESAFADLNDIRGLFADGSAEIMERPGDKNLVYIATVNGNRYGIQDI